MIDHLPECPPWVVITGSEADCICAQLRACEQRIVTREAIKRAEAHTQGFAEGVTEGRSRLKNEMKGSHKDAYQQGRDAGLSAARDAVAAARPFAGYEWNTYMEHALAAIDALRGESNG